MDQNIPYYKTLANRKIDVAKRNLVSVCSLSIKSLVDKACFSNIDDGCEELINFTANLEQILLHQIKPQKNWYGGAETLHFWGYLRTACKNIPQNCINNIDSIENIKSTTAKGRAFIRCALMEKRLSEYLSTAVKQTKLTKKFYMDGAIMLSEEATMICGVLLGLNAIDFSFCLKGQNIDLLGPLCVDYTPYLRYQQSLESTTRDEEEMYTLSNSSRTSSILTDDSENSDNKWKQKYKTLENKYRGISEQKGYLEELLRMREKQLDEANLQKQRFIQSLRGVELEQRRERNQLEQVIIELQAQLGSLKSDHQILQQRVHTLTLSNQMALGQVKEIQMADMAGDRVADNHLFLESTASDRHSSTSSVEVGRHVPLRVIETPDTRSLLSTNSEQLPQTTREDSHSLVPLAGSLTSQGFKSTGESEHKNDVVPVTQSVTGTNEFEHVNLHGYQDAAKGIEDAKSDMSSDTNDPKIDSLTVETSPSPREDNSTESESPVMVTSSESVTMETPPEILAPREGSSTESDSPVMVTSSESDDVAKIESVVEDSNSSEEEAIEVSLDDIKSDEETKTDQPESRLKKSDDSSSSIEEPVLPNTEDSKKRNSDSGSSDSTSWEVTQDRDFKQTSGDEQPEIQNNDEDK
ncbi:RUN domain-containing protein 3B isoform X1 [Patella vulgata]|uniref:RUN domain-containing protein 3B isoform X1 n=2 Tax=Patella vulgata TaxID=6465 RepID=UPI00217FC2D0|nr:RUN domain-containing protein 3B isoform X1 [Patella vulgata]